MSGEAKTTVSRSAPAILIEIGAGELIDRITILEIKAERFTDAGKLANVRHELAALQQLREACLRETPELVEQAGALKAVNLRLWEVEDELRDCEMRADFGPAFVALAREVYRTNDRRAALKKAINVASGARIVEEKSYAGMS